MEHPTTPAPRLPRPAALFCGAHLLFCALLAAAAVACWVQITSPAYRERLMDYHPDALQGEGLAAMLLTLCAGFQGVLLLPWAVLLLRRSLTFQPAYGLLSAVESLLPARFFTAAWADITEKQTAATPVVVAAVCGAALLLFFAGTVYMLCSPGVRAYITHGKGVL